MKINGYCPMGCGATLGVLSDRVIACTGPDCPRPLAAAQVLDDAETEHLVEFGDEAFTVRHPLRERLDDQLMDCWLHEHIASLAGPPVAPGRYRALEGDGGWLWEAIA